MWLATETFIFSQSRYSVASASSVLKAVPRKVDRRGNLPITGWLVINGAAFTNSRPLDKTGRAPIGPPRVD
jgi:hypothetical protein